MLDVAEEEAIFNDAFQDCRPWKFVHHGHDDGELVQIDPGVLNAHMRLLTPSVVPAHSERSPFTVEVGAAVPG